MNKKQETPIEQTLIFKIGAIVFLLMIILFFSTKKSSYSDSDPESLNVFWYAVSAIISLLISVFIARWAFKIDTIVSNQEKTNQLLESINDSLSNRKQTSELPTDVNDPDYLKTVIDKLK